MFSIKFSLIIASIIILFFIFVFFIVFAWVKKSNVKNEKSEAEKIEEMGWEIVKQIQDIMDDFQNEKEELDEKIMMMRNLEKNILSKSAEPLKEVKVVEKENKEEKRNNEENSLLTEEYVVDDKSLILKNFKEGKSVEVISKELGLNKGLVEVIINFNQLKNQSSLKLKAR